MLKTKIKASAISNLTDARYFAAFYVEWLGFNLEAGTPDYLPATQVKAIKEWVEGPTIVGEFGNMDLVSIQTGIELLELEAVQVGHFATKDLVTAINVPVIKEIIWHPDSTLAQLKKHLQDLQSSVAYFLLDFTKNDITWEKLQAGQGMNLADLQNLSKNYPLLLNIQIPAGELEDLLELDIQGLSVKGGEEEMVGYKSYEELDEIFEVLEIEE